MMIDEQEQTICFRILANGKVGSRLESL